MPSETLTILLVEDNPAHVHMIRKRLASYDSAMCVDVAGSLAEARTYLNQMHPDLAIVDLELPDGSGQDLVAEGWPLPMMILTCHDNVRQATTALAAGACDYLVKTEDVLDELPRLVLEMHQKRRIQKGRQGMDQCPERGQAVLQKFAGAPPNRFWSHGASITLC